MPQHPSDEASPALLVFEHPSLKLQPQCRTWAAHPLGWPEHCVPRQSSRASQYIPTLHHLWNAQILRTKPICRFASPHLWNHSQIAISCTEAAGHPHIPDALTLSEHILDEIWNQFARCTSVAFSQTLPYRPQIHTVTTDPLATSL